MHDNNVIKDKIENGIIIYGTGFEGERFYHKYYKKIRIIGVVDQTNDDFHGLRSYTVDELNGLCQIYFLVITVGEVLYKEIQNILEKNGLIECRDYIWGNDFLKKRIVIYANCHFVPIVEYMKMQMDIRKHFCIRYYRIGSRDVKLFPSECELNYCDVFITQDVREGNNQKLPGYESLINKVDSKRCKVVIVPNLYGCNLFFPQYSINVDFRGRNFFSCKNAKRVLTPEQEDIIDGLFRIRDTNIDKLFHQGSTIDDIENSIQNNGVYSAEDIKKNFEQGIRKIKQREKKCSICISDFIEETYKDIQLFYEPEHPTNMLLIELAKRIMKEIEIRNDADYDVACTELDGRELFIYGCVREALGLRYKQVYIRKHRSYSTLGNSPLSLREYIEDYIQCFFG